MEHLMTNRKSRGEEKYENTHIFATFLDLRKEKEGPRIRMDEDNQK